LKGEMERIVMKKKVRITFHIKELHAYLERGSIRSRKRARATQPHRGRRKPRRRERVTVHSSARSQSKTTCKRRAKEGGNHATS